MRREPSSRRTVLVVDDSPLIRRVVCDVIATSSDFTVVGEAADGATAIAMVHRLDPDLLTLDVQMPGLDGLATLGRVMREAPRPVVMLSALGDGGDTTMRALELGAVDFVRKPSLGDALDRSTLHERLLGALRSAARSDCTSVPVLARIPEQRRVTGSPRIEPPTHLVVIAASTGGPRALAEIVAALAPSRAAVLVIQHMPPGFTAGFARRLDALSMLPVAEAADGALLCAGRVYVAPGGLHTTVRAGVDGVRLAVGSGAPLHGVAPAADPAFVSAAATFERRCVAVVLTGMGHDGAEGARVVRQGGGYVIVQDAQTSIVYGMPQAALAAAGADTIAPLHDIAAAIARGLLARGLLDHGCAPVVP